MKSIGKIAAALVVVLIVAVGITYAAAAHIFSGLPF